MTDAVRLRNGPLVAMVATCTMFLGCVTAYEPPAPSGPGNPTPDSRPPCANATVTPEQAAKALAERARNGANAPRPALPPATDAIPIRAGAMPKHECFVKVAQRGKIDLLFVGDSITDFFGRGDRGLSVWTAHYGKLHAANFGISGDTTQDVLWRMRNGELDGFKAKVIVFMLGTNNIGRNDNADIAAGDAAIIAEFRRHQPRAKILLLGIFPRGDKDSPVRNTVKEINGHLLKLADNKFIFYADIGNAFLKPDGSFKDGVMADPVHPATSGYEIWAHAIEPMLNRLMR